jgi:hypothetical protein
MVSPNIPSNLITCLHLTNSAWHHFVQVVTGLLVAEVNVNTMCELGSGGVSLVVNP